MATDIARLVFESNMNKPRMTKPSFGAYWVGKHITYFVFPPLISAAQIAGQ